MIDVVSTGPYAIAAGDSIKVAFALIAGDDLADLQNSAVNAQTMYDGLLTTNISSNSEESTITIFPNPTNGISEIVINTAEAGKVELKVFNLLGEEMKEIASENISAGAHGFSFNAADLASGIYYYQLNIGSKKYVKKLIVTK